MNPEVKIDTGLTTYTLCGLGKCDITLNPTDGGFVDELYNAFDELRKKQNAYQKQMENIANKRLAFDTLREMDKEMRQTIDTVLGAPVCDAVFGKMNVYAHSNGTPVWCNLILSVVDLMDEACVREKKLQNPKIAKYVEKYQQK